MVEFFRFDHVWVQTIQDKVTIFSAKTSPDFSPTSPTKWNMCASLIFCVRERFEKYFLLTVWCRELSRPGTWFFSIWEKWIYTQNLLICNYDQHICSGFIKFFICSSRINWQSISSFQRIAFQRKLLLIRF